MGFPAPVVNGFSPKRDTNFGPVLDFHCMSLLSSCCEWKGAQEQPMDIYCSMSAFSTNNGGWKHGFTLHLTQSNYPKQQLCCLLPLALDWVSLWLQGVPQFSLLLQYPPQILVLCCQGSKLVPGKMRGKTILAASPSWPDVSVKWKCCPKVADLTE